MKDRILVLGSSNVDLILRIPRFHHPGETLQGENLVTVFGGKGANQAIASKRLGGKVIFMTRLGNDPYGKSYHRYLLKNKLRPKYLLRDKKLSTGTALIELIPKGENRIIVSPGANGSLSVKDLKRLTPLWQEIKVFVTQFEIPIETVKMGLKMAKKHGAKKLITAHQADDQVPLLRHRQPRKADRQHRQCDQRDEDAVIGPRLDDMFRHVHPLGRQWIPCPLPIKYSSGSRKIHTTSTKCQYRPVSSTCG